jgi:hypothetical protein
MTSPARTRPSAARIDLSAERMLELLRDLIEVLETENALLAGNLPASVTRTTAAKTELAVELGRIVEDPECRRRAAALPGDQRRMLLHQIERAQSASTENLTRLAAAIEATRRRVAAVMAAIREQVATRAPCYGGNGQIAGRVPLGVVNAGRLV